MRRAAAVLVLMVLVASGCAKQERVAVRRAAPGAKTGGTIRVAITEPSSIDPAAVSAFDAAAGLVNQTMCDRLIQFDPVTGRPVGAIAESWVVANGGATITVKLRKGVRFSDGSEVTAEDAAYSLSRVAMAETASPMADLLRHVKGYEALHGEDEDLDEDTEYLPGVSIVDNYSFEIALDRNLADFVRLLGHPIATPVPKRLAKADPSAFAARPVCAGPYKLARAWEPGASTIKLVRNAGYRAANGGYTRGGAGYADAIEFSVTDSVAAAYDAYAAKKVDVAAVPPPRVTDARKLGPDYVRSTSPALEYVGLPASVVPFGDRALRVALSLALDRRRIVQEVWGGARTTATSYLPPTLGKDLHRSSGPCSQVAPERGDVKKARAMYASSGVASRDAVVVRLFFNDEFANRKLMKAVADQWKAAFPALRPQLVPMPWEGYLNMATSPSGFAGAFRMAWAPQYPSAEEYLTPLFDSASAGRDNIARFSNAVLDRVMEYEARRATGDEDRAELYHLVEDAACSQMPVIPISYGATHRVVRSAKLASATDAVTDLTSGEVVLRELYVK